MRSRFEAAIPAASHAPAAKAAAARIQLRRSAMYPTSKKSSAAEMMIRGLSWEKVLSSSERKIPPAKNATGKRDGSFMHAVSVGPTPPYDMFVGKCQIN